MGLTGSPSRRRLLAAAASGGLLALGGCTETLPPLGQRVTFGRVDVPEAGPPAFRSWIPASSLLPDHVSNAPVHHAHPADLPPTTLGEGLLAARPDWLGTPFREHTAALQFGPVYVYEGATGPDIVASAFAETGFERAGTYEGYAIYDREDASRAVAVADDAVIWVSDPQNRTIVEAVIDAGAGRVARRHEVDDAFATITDAAGSSDLGVVGGLDLGLDATADATVSATTFAYRDDVTFMRSQYLFEHPDAVSERRIRRELRASERAVDAGAVDVRTDGRRVVVELRLEGGVDDHGMDRVPRVTWGAEHDAGDGTVTFRHEAGDHAAADHLRVSRIDRGAGGTAVSAVQFADTYDLVEPGDSIAVPVTSRTRTARIAYRPTSRFMTIAFEYDLP